MKKMILLMTVLLSGFSFCEETEKVSMVVGGTKSVVVPFVIESYRILPAKSEIVRVEASESNIRIMANKVGEVSLLVFGGGLQKDYTISVKSNLAKTLKQIRRDLDEITELDVSIYEDRIIIKGTVTDPAHWQIFQKVIPHYADKCVNYAVFKPSAETIINLKKMLSDAGFKFTPEGSTPQTGELQLNVSVDSVVLSGELYSPSEVIKIQQILASQTWLAVNGNPDASKGQVRGIVNLSVIESVLQVDVVYAGIVEKEGHSEGTGGGAPSMSMGMSVIYDIIAGKDSKSSAQFGGSMPETVSFLRNNGVTRTYDAGHVSFVNNDPNGGELHTGGTIYAKVSGIENGSLQNIDYGLKINVKGGLVSPTRAKLTLDLTNSEMVGSSGDSYDMAENTTKQTIYCDLDKTIVLAGSKKMMENTTRSGLPILRNTPVIKWFVAGDNESYTETRLLILISPRLIKNNPEAQITIPLDQETKTTYNDSKRSNEERIEEKKAFSGLLYWLNWFVW